LVIKFGGTSVADIERIKQAAGKVAAEAKRGHKLVVVVSAMSGETDRLISLCRSVTPLYDLREYDAVVATGEQITSGLMAIALQQRGLRARSWQGWQIPMVSDTAHSKARLLRIEADKLRARLEDGEVAVLAGFQGVTEDGRISTLGRGGSDTSAVALAAALNADRCDIYTDVDGVYTTDPRLVSQARKLSRITYEEMLEMASMGAKVLQTRSVEMAMKHKIKVQVLSTFENGIGSDYPGTLLTDEVNMEENLVTGITYARDEAKISVIGLKDTPGVEADLFGPLSDANINVDMIVMNVADPAGLADITFTVPRGDVSRVIETLKTHKDKLGYQNVLTDTEVAKVSVIGVGMRSHAGVATTMFRTLAARGINIQAISTSEIKISVLIAQEYAELAVRALHAAYGMEKG